MFLTAYAVARFLWIPLLACWAAAKGVAGRRTMWLPIAAGMLATAWELAVPASANIRIDLMLVGPVLMFADGLAGLLLAGAAYRNRKAGRDGNLAIAAAAVLCLAASAFFIFAWAASNKQADEQYREHVEGSRYYFEAAFRDDATQRETFGDLAGTRWAGYYVSDPPHPAFAHLVINSSGDFFLYTQDFYERHGRAQPDAADPALLAGHLVYLGNHLIGTRAEMRELGDGRLKLVWKEGGTSEVAFVKRPPPRFPRPPSPDDKVRFLGVFSGMHDDAPGYVHLAQVWLWQGEGRTWAVWLRGSFSREREQPVFGNNRVEATCEDKACTTLVLEAEGGAQKLRRDSPDELTWWRDGGDATIRLKRGEIVTGLPWARAPLSTAEENRKWLRAVHPDVTWKAPARPAADLPSSRGG